MEHQRLPVIASLLAIGSGVVWSIGAVLSRSAGHADAFQYLLWRSVGVVVVIELLAARRRQPFPTFRSWTSGRPMMVANIGLFLASLCFVYAVKTTTAANAAFLSSLTPLVASVFARFMGERLSRSTLVALATGVVGLTITVLGDLEAGNMAGNAAALASSIGFSIYTLAVRSDLDRDWSPALSGYGLLMITVCAGITLLAGKPLVPPLTDTMYALVHGAVVIVVGTLMFNAGSRHVPAVPMTVFAQTEMVFVPVWALLILHETPKALTLVGGAVTFAAVVGKAVYDTRIAAPPPVPVPDVPLL